MTGLVGLKIHFNCVCVCSSWVAYEGAQFTQNLYVLEKGDYPDPEAMGLPSPDSALRSVQPIGQVSTDPPRLRPSRWRGLTWMSLARSSRCPPSWPSTSWAAGAAGWCSTRAPSACSRRAWTLAHAPWWWREECTSFFIFL